MYILHKENRKITCGVGWNGADRSWQKRCYLNGVALTINGSFCGENEEKREQKFYQRKGDECAHVIHLTTLAGELFLLFYLHIYAQFQESTSPTIVRLIVFFYFFVLNNHARMYAFKRK